MTRLSGRGRTDGGVAVTLGLCTKGQVIRSLGRWSWERIPRDCYVRRGKRVYVSFLMLTRLNRGPGADVHGEDRPWCMP